MNKTTIYLVRHAEAEGNVREFFQGNLNTMITPKGERQLLQLAERFQDISLDAVYVSPFQRAVQTAEAVNRYHQLPLQKDAALREIGGGDWEGKTWAELPTLFPQAYQKWIQEMWAFQAPHGEAMTDVWHRMEAAMTAIAKQHFGQSIAVVSHGCALRNFLCLVEFGDIMRLHDVGWSDNTAVSCVSYEENAGWELIFKNDSSHLSPENSTLRNSNWCKYDTEKEKPQK